MLTLLKLGLSEYAENHVFGSLNLNNSEIFRLSFEDIFLETLDTYTKKMNPPSAVLGGGVHGKVCWLIAYLPCHSNSCCLAVFCYHCADCNCQPLCFVNRNRAKIYNTFNPHYKYLAIINILAEGTDELNVHETITMRRL